MLSLIRNTSRIAIDILEHRLYSKGSTRPLGNSFMMIPNKPLSTMLEAPQQPVESSESCDRVYVQHNEGKDMLTISFDYYHDGKTRQFNLHRKGSESLSSALERIKLNLIKLNKVKKGNKSAQVCDVDNTHDVDLCLNGENLNPVATKNINAWIEGAILKLNGRSYQVRTNEPQVEVMKLPSHMMKGFILLPIVTLTNCTIEHCKFTWYRQISAQEREQLIQSGEASEKDIELHGVSYWYVLGEGLTYSPRVEDVAHYLKVICKPSDGSKFGPSCSSIGNGPVELGPSQCPFEKRHAYTINNSLCHNKFRLVSYNILADLYADSDYSRTVLFAHCPTHALDMDYRKQLLLKEISGYNGDLICLQEVDKKEYTRTFEPFFKLVNGHSGIFDTKGGQVAEGLATFFRNDKFELIESHKTVLSNLIQPPSTTRGEETADPKDTGDTRDSQICANTRPHPILQDTNSLEAKKCLTYFDTIRLKILENPALHKRFKERHTIIQTSLLKIKDLTDTYLIVANTHLYFAPDADHIRLLQGCVCTKYLEYIKDYYKRLLIPSSEPILSVVFCGDMNSTPDCGLYKLLTTGKVDSSLPDWSSNKDEAVSNLSVETNFRFFPAYLNIAYTNYTPDFNGCLDYIYYESNDLECENTVPMPEHQDVIASGGIPSDVFPSDHLALIADLKLKQ